ncbi:MULTISPECIES: SMC family ATPase [unclassified Nocardioides]|uniref:AAA family ATPase n=1 Tax=unclassified Nocardioides TaxID=2615069 RepID=UPI0000EB61E2|nr:MULTISPECIES: SMC family ATPase [unclassified Nocardioides]ABL82205.1 putative exonuclease [Nocardioides sp. JS614]
MRLHHLEITAFGPFADTVAVDFDELSGAGLFLLSGATGSGKTSVLDAVCFALYGDVPGDRSTARRLRSDQAAPGVRPEVTLEATLSGRRFRIVRSPSWERPKKRGAGLTTEQASVSIAERIDGGWVTHSTRLDETGHLVTRLVGMNTDQFTQVAMLPQGRFQAFLRARSEERHRLLQQLFRTGRFEGVERWLRDRRLALGREAEALRRRVDGLVHRVSETTGTPAPEEGTADWAHALLADASAQCAETAAAARAAAEAEAEARASWEAARVLTERRARLDTAAAEHQRLTAATSEQEAGRDRLDAARRAAGVVPLHALAGKAQRAHSAARTVVDRLEVTDRGALEAAVAEAVDGAARMRALQPRAARLQQVRTETGRLERRQRSLAEEVAAAHVAARALVQALTAQVAEAREAHARSRSEAQRLRGHALDVREARLDGMVAELAGALAVGASCPVCGSCDHPHKAATRAGAPDDAAEKAAQRAADDAAATEHLRDVEVRDLSARLDAATEQVDQVPADLVAQVAAAETALDRLAAEASRLEAELADYDETVAADFARQEQAGRSALAALDGLAAAGTALEDARTALAAAVVDAGFASADEAVAASLDQRTYDRLAAAVADHDRRLAAVAAVLSEPGAAEVAAAVLPDLGGLESGHRTTLDALGAARAQESAWATRAGRLSGLAAELDAALTAWEPLRDELDLTTRLCSFVEGKSADNRLQMRLSAYVLAYRLSQVVTAANARLGAMSDQRYSLEHTGRRGAGETRGGLSLLVRDDWSGESRDPATLSGGETFVVSLALALGLADVVTQEAGGADLDTLFVDEGFGSLDADTLDDVMGTLDSLRDGGRVVGVVSHVAEMRDRIPAQLVVTKSRTGSTLRLSR